jgi:uncharacterized protein YjbI with pentapeptide repeats
MKKCSFRDADLSGVNARFTDFAGSDFSGANLQAADFGGSDLRKCHWERVSMSGVCLANVIAPAKYEQFSLDDAMKRALGLGMTQNQFEFMVLAGAVEIRDNDTLEVVKTGFDPAKHHVPVWTMENLGLLLIVDKGKMNK